jgi:hypothetical protein
MPTPIPAGRGRWRLTLHNRQFADHTWTATIIAQLDSARSRKLVQAWDTPATLTFDMDGHTSDAALIAELQHDVIAWRWDENSGADIPVFRGMVDASEDQIDEQSHVVTFTCHDYLAMFNRRIGTSTTWNVVNNMTQDNMADNWRNNALVRPSSDGTQNPFGGGYLPLWTFLANPDGTQRADSGVLRNYQAEGNMNIFSEFDKLAKLSGGFDYDVKPLCMPANGNLGPQVAPATAQRDALRIFYGGFGQGVANNAAVLSYGSSVSKIQRQVTSADYSNYWRTLGNNQSASMAAVQTYGEAWNSDANGTTVGLFMSGDAASATSPDATWLQAAAAGNVSLYGVLNPTYVVTLTPGWYTWGILNMGDNVPLVINSGRLAVNTSQRVLGITYNIGDDGQEDVDLIVARATTTLGGMLRTQDRTVNALARR